MIFIQKKLKNKRGASIVLALVFFLVAAVIGGIVLASAASNSGRFSHIRKEQQAYLTISSAAKIVREEIKNQNFKVNSTVVKVTKSGSAATTGPTVSFSADGSSVSNKVLAFGEYIYKNSSGTAPDGEFTIESELETVHAELTMDTEYNVTIRFFFMDGANESRAHELILTASAIENSSTVTSRTESEIGTSTNAQIEVTEKTVTSKIFTWDSVEILKGGV